MDNPTEIIQLFLGKHLLIGVAALVALLFKDGIKKIGAGLFIFFGSNYKEDDIVYVDGAAARIVRIGLFKTTFFIYKIEDGKITGGTKLVIANEELSKIKLEKPLPLLDLKK